MRMACCGQAFAFTNLTDGFGSVSYAPNYQDTGFSIAVSKVMRIRPTVSAVRGTKPEELFNSDDFRADALGVVLQGKVLEQFIVTISNLQPQAAALLFAARNVAQSQK
jgi:hypothetical protein